MKLKAADGKRRLTDVATTRQYKTLKGLKKENLRDNMSTLELALNLLAEATTAELTRVEDPMGLEENKAVSRRGGTVAGNARREIEAQTGRPVLTAQNAAQLNAVMTKLITDAGEAAPEEQEDRKPEGSD